MATKLQQLLDELKELHTYMVPFGYQDREKVVRQSAITELIIKYTETTPTYKPGDRVRVVKSCLKTFNGTSGYLIELHSKEGNLWKLEHFSGIVYFSEEEFEPIN